jgi:RHS repeat-associated protein
MDELLDFGEVLEEYEPDGDTLAAYSYGVDLIAQERAGQTSFFHTDGQGSTRMLTSPSAEATDRYFYEAYGELAEQSGSTPNSRLYRGEEFDSDLAAYYLRARYFDQQTGRLLSTDPIVGRVFEPLSFHLYAYAYADPVNHADPSGAVVTMAELQVASAIFGVVVGLGTAIAVNHFTEIGPVGSIVIGAAVGVAAWRGGLALAPFVVAAAPIVQQTTNNLPRISNIASSALTRVGARIQNPLEVLKRGNPLQKEQLTEDVTKMEEYVTQQMQRFPADQRFTKLNELVNKLNDMHYENRGNPAVQRQIEFIKVYVEQWLLNAFS